MATVLRTLLGEKAKGLQKGKEGDNMTYYLSPLKAATAIRLIMISLGCLPGHKLKVIAIDVLNISAGVEAVEQLL